MFSRIINQIQRFSSSVLNYHLLQSFQYLLQKNHHRNNGRVAIQLNHDKGFLCKIKLKHSHVIIGKACISDFSKKQMITDVKSTSALLITEALQAITKKCPKGFCTFLCPYEIFEPILSSIIPSFKLNASHIVLLEVSIFDGKIYQIAFHDSSKYTFSSFYRENAKLRLQTELKNIPFKRSKIIINYYNYNTQGQNNSCGYYVHFTLSLYLLAIIKESSNSEANVLQFLSGINKIASNVQITLPNKMIIDYYISFIKKLINDDIDIPYCLDLSNILEERLKQTHEGQADIKAGF